MSSLKAQVDELSRRNQILEAQVLPKAREAAAAASVNAEERVQVRVSPVAESTSEWRMVDIRVIVRGECPALDLVLRILEFLKGDDNLSLIDQLSEELFKRVERRGSCYAKELIEQLQFFHIVASLSFA